MFLNLTKNLLHFGIILIIFRLIVAQSSIMQPDPAESTNIIHMTTPSASKIASFINLERITESFLRMARIDTGSDELMGEKQTPSTKKQFDLANLLFKELKEDLKLQDVEVDENAIVTATFPSNIPNYDGLPVIGLLAHMDTAPAVPTGPVNPIIHKNYQGGQILLDDGKVVIPESDLVDHIGKDIITSDGKTLLGADDKAGIAEILETIRVLQEQNLPHPKIRIAFTPDEEIGMGIHKLDVKKFGADVAYTIDGDDPAIFEDGSFNAFNPEIIFQGANVHPGYAYGKMVNSLLVAHEFISFLPPNETPATTKDEDGYFHVRCINGDETQTKMDMLVRDFDFKKAEERIKFLEDLAKKLETKYGGPDGKLCKITVKPNPVYRNMKDKLLELPEIIEFGIEGLKRSGLKPQLKKVRGGTDGAILTLKDLLCPNVGSGGMNFHSKNEFVPKQNLAKCCEIVINILMVWTERAKEIAPKIEERRRTIKY